MSAIDIGHLRGWVGRESVLERTLEPFPARALAALLDRERAPAPGDALPLPWHWLYFLDAPRRTGTGPDGHPKRGGFLPPVPLPRRMWAGGYMRVEVPPVIGRPARRISTVRSVELKEGKSGPLVFVNVEHQMHQGERLCLSEDQHLVYREAPKPGAPPPPGEPAPAGAQWSSRLVPDPVLLFRFSALTYNGHRIHYDRDYATREEGYPGLVVHGPLLAVCLLDLLQRECPDAAILDFRFRALRPAFDTQAIELRGQREGEHVRLWTIDPEGMLGMNASARIA